MSGKIEERKSYQTWKDISDKLEILDITGKKKHMVMRLIFEYVDNIMGYRSETMSMYAIESLNEFIKFDSKKKKSK